MIISSFNKSQNITLSIFVSYGIYTIQFNSTTKQRSSRVEITSFQTGAEESIIKNSLLVCWVKAQLVSWSSKLKQTCFNGQLRQTNETHKANKKVRFLSPKEITELTRQTIKTYYFLSTCFNLTYHCTVHWVKHVLDELNCSD